MQSHLNVQPLEASSIAATDYHRSRAWPHCCHPHGTIESPVLDDEIEARAWLYDYAIAAGLQPKPVVKKVLNDEAQRQGVMDWWLKTYYSTKSAMK